MPLEGALEGLQNLRGPLVICLVTKAAILVFVRCSALSHYHKQTCPRREQVNKQKLLNMQLLGVPEIAKGVSYANGIH